MESQTNVATRQPSVSTSNGVRKEITKSAITFDRIYKADFQKPGTLTVQIRQVVTTKSFYPERKTTSNLQQGLFSNEEFGFTSQEFTSHETRVAWLYVPEKTEESEVLARIAAANAKGATIYRVLSNVPILDDNQEYAIKAQLRTMDNFADTQVVRYPENEETLANGTANKINLDPKGNVQYRRTFFWSSPMEDYDTRNSEKVYLSAAIKAELAVANAEGSGASALKGQTI